MTQGDWLLALGGKQTTADNFHEVLLSFKPRQRIEVAYFHRGRLYQETVRLGEKPAGKLELRIKQPMAAEDLSRLRRWLGESVSLPQSKESPR
jgi:predicted metalloprotease with PDZ domain